MFGIHNDVLLQGKELTTPFPPTALIPNIEFSTEALDVPEQFDGFRDFMAPLSDVDPLTHASSGFHAHVKAYDLGVLQLVSLRSDPSTFSYTKKHIRQYGMDNWSLNVVTKGNMEYTSGSSLKGTPGEMHIHSYASPFAGTGQDLGVIQVMLNRDIFHNVADGLDREIGQSLGGSMPPILCDFVRSIETHADRLTMAELPALNEAFSQLLKATFRPNADTLEAAKSPIASSQFATVRRIINENLKSPALTPDIICLKVGVSRRQLYYMFEPHGGVVKYINQRRLAACHNALVTQTEKKPISSIAYEYGFTNLSTFYRQFHARYGFRPSETRSAWLNGHRSQQPAGNSFADWLAQRGDA